MRFLQTSFFCLLWLTSFGQTGSSGDPFTSLNQGSSVTVAGIYYFNLGGTLFDTHIDANGYIQVAIDFGDGIGDLPQGTTLTSNTRGILNPTVLAKLTETQEVRISSSTGTFDVTTTNSTIISRIQSNTTLHKGVADNIINDDWTGTNAVYITANGSCNTTSLDLHKTIIHICGNSLGTHWIPSTDNQMEKHMLGDIANSAFLQLWVKGSAILPIELTSFTLSPIKHEAIQLDWQTASEINNDYFTIERSKNGIDWQELTQIEGAGNATSILNYSEVDRSPFSGLAYYRLKQTDFDRQFSYSEVKSIDINQLENNQLIIYPNPTNDFLTIESNENHLKQIRMFNVLGQEVSGIIESIGEKEKKRVFDLSNLNSGIYFLITDTTIDKIYKQ